MKPRGFIALMSSIIISSVLLVVAAAGSLLGFYMRANISDAELKVRSKATADACADMALVALVLDPDYMGGEVRSLNSFDVCQVRAVTQVGTQKVIAIQATSSQKIITNLQVVYEPTNQTVVTWREVP